jgi:hypothetical protein
VKVKVVGGEVNDQTIYHAATIKLNAHVTPNAPAAHTLVTITQTQRKLL